LLPKAKEAKKEKLGKISALFGKTEITKERKGKEISAQGKCGIVIVQMPVPAFSEKKQKCSEKQGSKKEQLG